MCDGTALKSSLNEFGVIASTTQLVDIGLDTLISRQFVAILVLKTESCRNVILELDVEELINQRSLTALFFTNKDERLALGFDYK